MRCFDGPEQQRRDPHTSRAQRARGRCAYARTGWSAKFVMDGLVTSAGDASLNLPHTVTTRLLRREKGRARWHQDIAFAHRARNDPCDRCGQCGLAFLALAGPAVRRLGDSAPRWPAGSPAQWQRPQIHPRRRCGFSVITFVPRYLHGGNGVVTFRPTTRSRPRLGLVVRCGDLAL